MRREVACLTSVFCWAPPCRVTLPAGPLLIGHEKYRKKRENNEENVEMDRRKRGYKDEKRRT